MPAELQEINPSPGRVLNILTGILIVMFPVGLILMFTESLSGYLWTTTIFLGLEALITFMILIKLADLLSVVITTAVIFMASWFIEYLGVNTAIPFGAYTYSHVLSPLIGGVPLAITFAWFTVAANSLLAARFFLNGYSEVSAILIASIFILATDVLLEPFASFINNFWVWEATRIPVQNFASWFIIGIIFVITFSQLIKWHKAEAVNPGLFRISLIITGINIANFSIVNIANGYYFLTITGIVIFAVIILSIKLIKPAPAKLAG